MRRGRRLAWANKGASHAKKEVQPTGPGEEHSKKEQGTWPASGIGRSVGLWVASLGDQMGWKSPITQVRPRKGPCPSHQ